MSSYQRAKKKPFICQFTHYFTYSFNKHFEPPEGRDYLFILRIKPIAWLLGYGRNSMLIELLLIHITDINLPWYYTEQRATLFLVVAFEKLTIIFLCQDNYHFNKNMS